MKVYVLVVSIFLNQGTLNVEKKEVKGVFRSVFAARDYLHHSPLGIPPYYDILEFDV
jgi:hypothetical protein